MHKRNPVHPEEFGVLPVPQFLLTVAQAAAALNMAQSSVYELMNEEGLPYVLVKGAKRISPQALQIWINQRQCSTIAALQQQLRASAMETPASASEAEKSRKRRTRSTQAPKKAS
jgi:hypothetical protein